MFISSWNTHKWYNKENAALFNEITDWKTPAKFNRQLMLHLNMPVFQKHKINASIADLCFFPLISFILLPQNTQLTIEWVSTYCLQTPTEQLHFLLPCVHVSVLRPKSRLSRAPIGSFHTRRSFQVTTSATFQQVIM